MSENELRHIRIQQTITIFGCTLRLVPGELYEELPQPGSMLIGTMDQLGDGRTFEVYLSETDRRELIEMLMGAQP